MRLWQGKKAAYLSKENNYTFIIYKMTKNDSTKQLKASPEKKEVMPLGKINYILIVACVVLIMLGFYLMTGSANTGTTWNEDVFNSTRTVVGPMVALAGFTLMIFAIIFKKKDQKTGDSDEQA